MWTLASVLMSLGPVTSAAQSVPGYDFSRPAASLRLPAELREVSGLTGADGDAFVCVQDEDGVLFVVDAGTGEVRERHPFAGEGDYEGLARVGADYWVLRSDGRLLRVAPQDGGLALAETVELELPHDDFEGLCHDVRNGQLLIAPKAPLEERKDPRPVFAFDLERRELLEAAVLDLSHERLVAEAQQLGLDLPTRTTKQGKEKVDLKLRFSAIAIHPISDEIWLLSGPDKLLLVVTRSGDLVGMCFLGDRLPQAEGLTFFPGGDVLIASEGQGPEEPAVVERFTYESQTRPERTGAAPGPPAGSRR